MKALRMDRQSLNPALYLPEGSAMAERIGFYICHCGINIAFRVRVEEVAEYVGTLPNVASQGHHRQGPRHPPQLLAGRCLV